MSSSYCWRGFCVHVQTGVQSDGQWVDRVPCYLLSPLVHLASWSQGIIVCTVLFWDWTKPTMRTEIKGPISGEGTKTKEKLQNAVTEETA